MSLKIIGTGSALPQMSVSNEDLTLHMETDEQWISSRTGIKKRRICNKENLVDLGVEAAINALLDAGITADSLDYIICPTLQGDLVTPALACQIQGRIGANCPAFDINSACTGFVYGLDLAAAYLQSNKAKNILIVCAEAMSRLVDWSDRTTCILFGDGAGAAIVSQGDALKSIYLSTKCDEDILKSQPDYGNCPFVQDIKPIERLSMNGQEVYKFAVASATQDINFVAQQANIPLEEVSYFIIHQANLRIIDGVRSRLKQATTKFPANIQAYGNTSSASIPILLDELNKNGTLQKGQILALSAFGAGLNTGACILIWDKQRNKGKQMNI